MSLKILKEKSDVVFNPKNYKNSPIIRDLYRFIAKNGLRADAHRMLATINGGRDKTSYLSKIVNNIR